MKKLTLCLLFAATNSYSISVMATPRLIPPVKSIQDKEEVSIPPSSETKAKPSEATLQNNNKDYPKELEPILKVVDDYRLRPGVVMDVDRRVEIVLLGKSKKSTGQLFFSKGQLRMDLREPEPMTVVMGKDVIWVENRAEGFSQPQVTKVDQSGRSEKNALLAFLFGNKKIWLDFDVVGTKKQDEEIVIELKPKKPAQYPDAVKMRVTVSPQQKQILQFTHWDEIENKVSYKFSSIKFKKIAQKKFVYTPPADAQITEYK